MKTLICFCVALLPGLASLEASNPPTTRPASESTAIARFTFNNDAGDDSRDRTKVQLKHAPIDDGSLILNGMYEFGRGIGGYRAVFNVPALDYKSFTVIWRFKADSFDENVNGMQRCLLTGGTMQRWLVVSRRSSGKLHVGFNNDSFGSDIANTDLKVGVWTQIACAFDLTNRRMLVMIDRRKATEIHLPDDFSLQVIGSEDEKADRDFAFTNYSNADTFHGRIDELIVFPRAMSEEEIAPFWRPQ